MAEPAWNDSLLFDNTGNRHTASIVNKGTLSDVVIDLSGVTYGCTTQGEQTLYCFDLRQMLNCDLTLTDVTFDATGVQGIPCGSNVVVGMDFGTDVMMNGSPAITLLLPQAEPTELMVQQPGMVMFALQEPATATLSLLAPAALCVRRR